MPRRKKPVPTRVWGSMSLTCSLGNYESMRLEAGEEYMVDGRDPTVIEKALRESLFRRLEAEAKQFITGKDLNMKQAGQVTLSFINEEKS